MQGPLTASDPAIHAPVFHSRPTKPSQAKPAGVRPHPTFGSLAMDGFDCELRTGANES